MGFGGPIDSALWAAVKEAFPDATLNSAYRPGDSGFHGKGQAIDVGGPMQAIANWAVRQDLAQVIYGPGPLLYNVGGTHITDQSQLRNQVYADDLAGHYDHVHIASEKVISGGPASPADDAPDSLLGSSNPISAASDVLKAAAKVTDALTNRDTWIRILKLIGGTLMVLIGLYAIMQTQLLGGALKLLGGDTAKSAGKELSNVGR